ncbi:hypothetical protein AVEN_115346-1 [Araneus ventricosus]|uniref:DUF5641 domain-containing protein n=1 Tax=Araneus ventricosus TaxID=182803 RepID=A0A4Y1ZY44_ARAVE|nr:hypothetical protein AVEN_115346-1 [Araneus ventricosus]
MVFLPKLSKCFCEKSPSGVSDIDTVDKEKLSKRAKYLQKIREQLGGRFRMEYLGQLRQQSIKNYKDKSLDVEEIVLLEDSNKKLTYWNLDLVFRGGPGKPGNCPWRQIPGGAKAVM